MTKNKFREAQREQADKSTAAAVEHDLPHMDDKRQAYLNGYLDGFYRGARYIIKDYDQFNPEGAEFMYDRMHEGEERE